MSKFLVGAFVVALCCALQNAHAADSRAWKPGDALIKPAPADHSPFLPRAEEAARDKFPELFQGKFTGTMAIYVDLNIDGEVFSLNTKQFPAGPITDRSLSKEQSDALMEISLHDVYRQAGAQGSKFIGWFGPKRTNGLYLNYRVLKWRLNPARTAARVRSAVAERYPEFHSPRLLERSRDDSKTSLVTVAMNDDGTVSGAILVEDANDEELSDRKMFDRFRELGLKPEQLAYRGRTTNQGDWQDKNLTAPLLLIQYAWRRGSDDPPDEVLTSSDAFERISLLHLQAQQSDPPDEEFLKRSFSDVWQSGLPSGAVGVWLLLARSGEAIDSGFTYHPDYRAAEEEIQKRYAGIKVGEGSMTSAKIKSGSAVYIHYVWIAPDSLVVPKERIEKH